jgi:sugar/nucleoside kinase (ribokinase family)
MTGAASIDVVAIGSALVDILTSSTDDQLAELGLVKGSMELVTLDHAHRLYDQMGPAVEASGGSAANTVVGVAGLGGTSAYLARVAEDDLGQVFTHDIRAAGVHYRSPPASSGPATGRCLIFVTPDGERTMCTYLGAASHLGPDYVDAGLIARASVVYLEGYLWDLEPAKAALRLAVELAGAAGAKVALTLSDPFCVERHRHEFRQLVEGGVDMVFGNEDEVKLLFETDDLDTAMDAVGRAGEIAAITRGAAGSVVTAGGETLAVAAEAVDHVVDTTGAGDLYAAGFLFGLTHGADLEACARLGGLAAAEVISHMGPRPQADLAVLAKEAGLAV